MNHLRRWASPLLSGTRTCLTALTFLLGQGCGKPYVEEEDDAEVAAEHLSEPHSQPPFELVGPEIPGEHAQPVDPEVAALIDRLVDVADEGPGTHSTAWSSGFIVTDEEMAFTGGILGSKKPVVSPVMVELVRLGVAALPDLLNHLTDARETRLAVAATGMGHSSEYDPRYRDPKQWPPEVSRPPGRDERRLDGYRLKVGDLCYVAVGQIVNRDLVAARYQPSLCMVINSPVATPALAAAARRDWSGLTPKQHKRSLIHDANLTPGPALKRLCFYYPEEAESVALQFLARPLINETEAWEFLLDRLVKEKRVDRWESLIAKFAEEKGQPAANAVTLLLWRRSCYRENDETLLREKRRTLKFLARYRPSYDRYSPPFVNAASVRNQTAVVEALAKFPGERVDAAVAQVFRSSVAGRLSGFDWAEEDYLAVACMDRLAGKGMDRELVSYCERRIKELQQKKREIGEDQRLEFLKRRLQGLKAKGDT